METNFYVGQEIVAIKDHSQGDYKKGDEFVILGIKKGCCNVLLNIGIIYDFKGYSGFTECLICGNIAKSDGYCWYSQSCFAPKQQLSETTYNDIQEWIKQGKELAILN